MRVLLTNGSSAKASSSFEKVVTSIEKKFKRISVKQAKKELSPRFPKMGVSPSTILKKIKEAQDRMNTRETKKK